MSDSLLRVRAARCGVGAKAAASAASSASDNDSDDSLPALVYASSSDDDSDSLSAAGGEAEHAGRALCASDAAVAVALADLDARAVARAALDAAATSFSGQLIGAATIFVWVFGASFIVWGILKATMGIRVSEEEEFSGVDIAECGMEAYPEFVSAKS